MKALGVERGYAVTIDQIESGLYPNNSAPTISLRNVSVRASGDGLYKAVLGFLVVPPTLSFSVVASTGMDGCDLAQCWANVYLTMGDKAPPASWEMGQVLINNVDGYRLAAALGWLSGQPIFPVRGKSWDFLAAPTADVTSANAAPVGAKFANDIGWPQFCGPYGAADAGGATFSSAPSLWLPIGIQADEPWSETAIPAQYFNPELNDGSCLGAPGSLNLTLGSAVNGNALTAGAQGWTLYQISLAIPCSEFKYPTTPFIETSSPQVKRFKLRRGMRKFFSFMPPLAAGVQRFPSYTAVNIISDGVSIVNQQCQQQMNGISITESIRGIIGTGGSGSASNGFFMTQSGAGATLSFRGAARIENAQVALLMHRGMITDSPGNVDSQTEVQIVTTGETVFDYVDVTLTPRPAVGWDMARVLGEKPLGLKDVKAANGNLIAPGSSLEQVLPAALVDPAPNPNAYKAG